MSGICGQFNLDDTPVAAANLRAMTYMLRQRGPEGTAQTHNGPIGLGHTLLATTHELAIERQPFTHQETGCLITADVRLDNREELLHALGLSGQHESSGDAELILVAYLEWGEACLDRLLGDFAFAIWDARQQRLFCARDHFGMRPFYYHHAPGKRFVFASDARAILVLPQAPYKVSEERVADFLVPQLQWIDYTSTFFEDVFRLPPGHKATVTSSGLNIAEYWKLEPGPETGPMSDEDYAQGFLEVFTQAVAARLRAPPNAVGSMLSGGMDSGSVVAVGKDLLAARGDGPLPTYSCARHRGEDCAESRAIYAASSIPSISPTLLYPESIQDMFVPLLSGNEEPFDGEFVFLKSIYFAARDNGQRIVLDGGGGDVVLSEGSYIVRLIRDGQYRLAMAEITAQHKFWGSSSIVADAFRYTRAALPFDAAKKRLRKLKDSATINGYLRESLISHDFANRVHINSRHERMRQLFSGQWSANFAIERCNAIRPNVTGGRERYARLAAGAAVEACDPFLDRRVAEYCARLPGRLRLKNGWPKMLLRELMRDRLPKEVLWCRGKPHLGWVFNAALTRHAQERGELDITSLQAALADYVDPDALARDWRIFLHGGDAEVIHSAFTLATWLQENERRPVVPDGGFG